MFLDRPFLILLFFLSEVGLRPSCSTGRLVTHFPFLTKVSNEVRYSGV